MTQTYRTSDLARWGGGKGSDLSPTEVDINFWDIIQRIIAIEELPDPAAGIESFSVSGTNFYVNLTDGTQLGPYPLPVATFRARGTWTPITAYSVLDTVDYGGALYMVLFSHVSAATFDPGANDGAGHEYYGLMLSTPASVIPTGGAAGMTLTKSTSADYASTWAFPLPEGGDVGQVLVKLSSTEQDAAWDFAAAENVNFTPITDSTLTSTNVADALQELSVSAGGGGGAAVDVTFDPDLDPLLFSTNVQAAINELSTAFVGLPATTGKQTIWIPATAMTPRTTQGAAVGVAEMTTYKNMINTLDFDATTEEYAQFDLILPKSWGGTNLEIVPLWSHGSGSSVFGAVWKIDYAEIATSGVPGGTLDRSFSSGPTILSTGGSVNSLVVASAGTLFPGSTSGVVLRQFRIYRVPGHASDTLTIDARLHGVVVYYYTNQATDN